jgi:glycerol-3-phosphate acyltransferase PlsX
MRIAVDALGGDKAPREVVTGAVAAAERLGHDEIFLVGDKELVRPEVGASAPRNLSLRDAGGPIGMGEEAAALLRIGRLEGCRRPAIATVLPLSSPVLLLDAGATVMCRPQDLLNFAILGGVFAQRYFDLDGGARVGLVNVGEEPGKGNDLAKEAHRLMSESPGVRFVGNVEGRDIGSGVADVLVTDGFTGNVILKTAEGVAREILGMLRSAMTGGAISKLAAGILRPGFVGVRDRVDPENYGGSFLLGVRGPVVIGHGNSGARGVENALVGLSRTGAGLAEALEGALAGAHAAAPARGDAS